MLVEIYVQSESGDYELLELFGDENINIKFVLKDSSDLSKVYSTYSQTFTIPAYGRNRRILRYYFDTPVVRTSLRYLNTKIYVNKELFKVGLISINEGTYKMGRQYSYNINFFTSLTNLKELFGDETLSQTLSNTTYDVKWSDGRVYLYSQAQVVNPDFDPDLIVPLVSNKRVWTYEDGSGGVNNIRYTGSINGVKHIQPSELRPAIPFSRIMEDIASVKNLTFKSSIFEEDVYKKLYVWCNGKNNKYFTTYVNMQGSWSGTNTSPWVVQSTSGGTIITLNYGGGSSNKMGYVYFDVRPFRLYESEVDILIKIKFINSDTNVVISEQDMKYSQQQDLYLSTLVLDAELFGITSTTPLNIRVEIEPNQYITWEYGIFRFRSLNYTPLPVFNANLTINTYIENTEITTYKLLPEIKTLDFLSSFIKMFNMSIIEDNTSTNIINFIPRNTFYTEKIDYTKYINIEEYKIKPSNLFKKINFKHKTSNYKSNIDFKIAIGDEREYGELKYSSPDIQLKDEYKIETQFSIVPNRLIPNTNIQTFYGFLDESEDSVDYDKLWKPNTEDLTIFYYNGSQQLKDVDNNNISLNFKITEGGATIIEDLNTYNKVSIVYNDGPLTYINSLGYKDELDVIDNSFKFYKNLFTNYYEFEIDKIYNPNSRLFEYNCILPTREINSFSLDKLIIIGDRKFSIEQADINIINGKTKLTLMNISPSVLTNINYIPNPPQIFTATLL